VVRKSVKLSTTQELIEEIDKKTLGMKKALIEKSKELKKAKE
jgi:hypothetical protein